MFFYKDIGSDSSNIGLPLWFHASDYLHNMGGIPRWTFYMGMGQNFLGSPANLSTYAIVVSVYVFVRLYNQYGWTWKMLSVYGQLAGLGILGFGMMDGLAVN
jgi:hypothetical protein